MTDLTAVMVGCGVAIPPLCVDNHMLSRVMETSDEWIRERSGIVTRYYVEPGVGSSQLGAEASEAALADAGLEAGDLDYIICATMTPDHYFPGAATMIQERLGIGALPSLDIRQQCAGFAYGLQMVDALIRSRQAARVLLVGCDVHTSLMPFSQKTWDVLLGHSEGPLDRETRAWNSRLRHLIVLFGDGAGAMVFEAQEGSDGRGILGSVLYGDGRDREILYVPGGGSASRPWVDRQMIDEGGTFPFMDGRQVFKHAVKQMPRATREVLTRHGFGLEDLDLLVMHQANLRINEAAQKMLRIEDDKVHNNIQKYGNTTSATLPICFQEARQLGKAEPDSLVAFTALGAGLHWGSVLMRL